MAQPTGTECRRTEFAGRDDIGRWSSEATGMKMDGHCMKRISGSPTLSDLLSNAYLSKMALFGS